MLTHRIQMREQHLRIGQPRNGRKTLENGRRHTCRIEGSLNCQPLLLEDGVELPMSFDEVSGIVV